MTREFPELGVKAPETTAEELKRRLDSGERVTVLDTRRPEDFEAWHIEHPNVENVNVPFTEFLEGDESEPEEQAPVRDIPDEVPGGEVVTCCAVGVSSKYVADLLRREGHPAVGLEDGLEAWARLYELREVESADGSGATVLQYHRPSSGCLSYMVVSEDEAVFVDPLRAFVERYESDARERGARVVATADTHVHADHVSGVRELGELTGAKVVVPEGAEDRGLEYDVEYTTVGDGDKIVFGGTALEAVALPGHTTEMTGYRLDDSLLAGDTVFLRSVARPDLEKGDEGAVEASRQLFETLEKLGSMPEETVVAPGHASGEGVTEDGAFASTVGELLDRVPLFGMSDKEEFVERMTEEMPPRPANYRRIISVNLGQSEADPDEAFELELGPNNCAVS